jgi:centromere protein C
MSTEQQGRRTGVKVAEEVAYTAADGMEDPSQLFETAQSPSTSVGSGKENDTMTTDALEQSKPKKHLRFSIAPDVADELNTTVNSQHPARKLARQQRDSMDTSDLSSVSTAAASVTQHHDEDSEVEASRKSGEEEEDTAVVVHQRQRLESPGDFPMDNNYDNDLIDNEEDDDLVPPPPPDSPEREAEDDAMVAQPDNEETESESENPRVSFPAVDEPPKQDAEDDFPTEVDAYDDDDDKEGPGFQMEENEQVNEDDESDPDTPGSVKEKRRKEEQDNNLEKKKKDAASVRTKDSRKKKKKKRKADQSVDEETETEDEAKTPAPKQRKTKKKFNPFATTFSPKGVPLPRTYTSVPVSDYKEGSPDDKNLRRSKRARTTPLEFWRGEKPVFGANDFGEDYDGVKNMPIVVGFAKADPTPYKKRKVPALAKKKSGKKGAKSNAAVAAAADEPFDTSRLRNKLHVNDGKNANLWDERFRETRSISKYCIDP